MRVRPAFLLPEVLGCIVAALRGILVHPLLKVRAFSLG